MKLNNLLFRKLLICFLFLTTSIVIYAQNNNVDSLLTLLKTEKTDTGKVNYFNKLFLEYEYTDNVKAKYYIYEALRLSKKINYEKGLATTYKYLGIFADDTSNFQQAIIHFRQSLKISEKLGDKKSISAMLGAIGTEYYYTGEYPKALEYNLNSLKIAEEISDKSRIAKLLGNMGIVYEEQSDYFRALDYYFKALKIAKAIDDKNGIASDLGNIGNVYKKQASNAKSKKDSTGSDSLYKKSLDYYFNALRLAEELDDKNTVATQFSNIGTVYQDQKEYQKALDYSFRALKMDEELGYKPGIATDFGNIGSLFTSIKKYKEAERYLLQALAISDSISILKDKMQFENSISELYTKMGKDNKAFEHYKKAMDIRDTLFNEAKSREIMNFEFEKKEASAKAEQDKKDALVAAESRRQRVIMWFFIIGFTLVVFFTFLFYKRWQKTQKQKKIIEEQKQEVESKNKIIEEINKDITDSIHYAKRIQTTILPSSEYAGRILGEHFILFKPKDIVSGDFYWGTRINEWLIITVADCTGHGVPGAFMSMLGVSFLNEIVRKQEINQANEVLNELRKEIINALQQKGISGEQKDGMDISLLVINTETNECQWAGANNPLYLIPNPSPKEKGDRLFPKALSFEKGLGEVKGDKMPIAIYLIMNDFTNHEFKVEKGDCIYLCSDGYEDQFGGQKNKKFMAKQLKELFLNIADKPMTEQQEILNTTFENWRGNNEQVDDVTILGLKI